MPPMASNKFEKYCEQLVSVLKEEKSAMAVFSAATGVLDKVLGGQYQRDKAKDVSLFASAEAAI